MILDCDYQWCYHCNIFVISVIRKMLIIPRCLSVSCTRLGRHDQFRCKYKSLWNNAAPRFAAKCKSQNALLYYTRKSDGNLPAIHHLKYLALLITNTQQLLICILMIHSHVPTQYRNHCRGQRARKWRGNQSRNV